MPATYPSQPSPSPAQVDGAAFGDAGRAHGFDEVVHRTGRDPMDIGLLDHGRERLLGRAARLQEGREVRAFAQLGDSEIDPACSRVPGPFAIAVAVIEPLGAPHAR